jgi:hypothetical protein
MTMAMDEQQELNLQEIEPTPLRTYHGDERRRPLCGAYDGMERRILDPLTEQDEDREPPPN